MRNLDLVVIGLSISSSWGNGHATTYRSLLKAMAARGAHITFLERDVAWYRGNRDMPAPDFAKLGLYEDLDDLRERYAGAVRGADAVIVGSYVPEGIAVIDWVLQTARGTVGFYDIDTPVTLARLSRDECDYLACRQMPCFDVYLSFTGGPTLAHLEMHYGAQRARPLYCSVDTERYRPDPGVGPGWQLGYLGTYSTDRQPALDRLLLAPARATPDRRFVVAGPQYPAEVAWPANVERVEHLPPEEHAAFYNRQIFTLNITRADMRRAGWSPSVRLFEAAACAVPIISDRWQGLEEVFPVGEAILVADDAADVLGYFDLSERRRRAIGEAAREVVLMRHRAEVRAAELEGYLEQSQVAQGIVA